MVWGGFTRNPRARSDDGSRRSRLFPSRPLSSSCFTTASLAARSIHGFLVNNTISRRGSIDSGDVQRSKFEGHLYFLLLFSCVYVSARVCMHVCVSVCLGGNWGQGLGGDCQCKCALIASVTLFNSSLFIIAEV